MRRLSPSVDGEGLALETETFTYRGMYPLGCWVECLHLDSQLSRERGLATATAIEMEMTVVKMA